MRKIFTILSILLSLHTIAQIPEDAVRYSWYIQNGSARSLAIGGAMGALGGDLTSNFVNPAGIGFYRTNEASLTTGFLMNKSAMGYANKVFDESKNALSIGTIGFAIARQNDYNQNKSNAYSIAITQNANFNNIIRYKGLNNISSLSQVWADEFKASSKGINDLELVNPYTVAPALYTYLIDTVRRPTDTIIKTAPEYILEAKEALQQEITKTTKGGLYEIGLSYAGNDGEKFVWGLSVGIPIVNYESNTLFVESDTSARTNNYFKSFTYNDNFKTSGIGINAKLGIIYRPKEYIRLGIAIHTPSYMSLTDSRQSSLKTELENPVETFEVKSDLFTNDKRGEAKYLQNAPWKAILSASYVFREIEDVTKQRGFISADIEYVRHTGTKFSSDAEAPTAEDKAYYKQLNSVIKDIYKGNINARVGAEIKFNTIMGRVGFGYYGNPYKDAPVKANKMTLSGGLGYRNKGFFADLTYVHLMSKDFDVPYRLQNTQTLYASVNQTRGNIVATFGVKF
jgi:hypothetical protein